MEGTTDLPPTEKVKLLNINSSSGHHADYATITILRTASMDPVHPHIDALFLLCQSSHVRLELKPTPRDSPVGAPCRHTLTHSRTIVHKHKPWALRDHCSPCYTTQWKYKLIWQKCENAHVHARTHTDCRSPKRTTATELQECDGVTFETWPDVQPWPRRISVFLHYVTLEVDGKDMNPFIFLRHCYHPFLRFWPQKLHFHFPSLPEERVK